MRLETLEDRIYALIRRQRPPLPQLVKSSSSSTISTMIPTPGMSNCGTSNLMVTSSLVASTIASSGSISIAPTNVNTGSLLPPGSGTSVGINSDPFTSNDGLLSNVYPGGNNMMSSMGAQSSKSQMICTPSSNGINSRSFMNMESCDIGNGVPSVDSTMVSQQHQQAYGLSNGALNGGLGTTTSRIQKKHGSDTPEGYLSGTLYGNGYGISSPDNYGTANFYGTVASAGSMNNLNLDPISSQSISKSSSQSITNQSNLHHQLQQQQQCFQNQCQPNQQSQHHQLLLQNQFQQNSLDDHSGSGQFLSIPSAPPLLSQSQPIRLGQTKNEFSCPLSGAQSESLLKGQWHPHEQHIQEEFRQRNIGQDEARRNNLLLEGSMGSQAVASISAMDPLSSSGAICRSGNAKQDKLVIHQQMWLLFMRHARRCQAPEGKCPDPKCIIAQRLWKHLETCPLSRCPYPRCSPTKKLFNHYRHCKDKDCPVCVPVNNFFRTKLKSFILQGTESGLPSSTSGSCKPYDTGKPLARSASKALSVFGTLEDLHPLKRKKTDQPSQSLMSEREGSAVLAPMISVPHAPQDLQLQDNQHVAICMPTKSEFMEVKMSALVSSRKESPSVIVIKRGTVDNIYTQKPDDQPFVFNEPASLVNPENIKPEKELDQAKEDHVTLTVTAEQTVGTESVKPKIKGVSLIELFTQKQVREHISGLRQWVGQSKAKAEKNQAMKLSMSENSCQLCAVERLTFEPPPIYCTPCGFRIRRNAMFYTVGTSVTRYYFCIRCYNETRGDTMFVGGTPIKKEKLEKRKNDEEIEEPWVLCDKCQAWQHQICALFNGRRNDDGQAEYTCPNCYITEIERGEREPLSQNAVLGAKDLPRTILSDHIEQRLFRKLKKERQERATLQGKSYDEVPGAEALVVRVVSSVDKKLEVKQRFREIFQEENYPIEFPYKSKVILLFQKIEGVEVCLFGMYVQEFGSECQFPNQRRVYVSYLDSVKYFRPEIKAVNGEALRTFVYHEILIGYLEYCKKRGFTSCYIWACPPLKGEDYILYCHPEIQKTPKSDKLREWYLSMLRKASKENIVVGLTNLYDNFFVTTGECKTKVTAARLPYFDGDYWPGAAEDMLCQLQQEEDERKHNRKGTIKKTITKRALKAFGRADLSGNASKDFRLMYKLGETIGPMKEDFIMVHLQHACTHCCLLMISGNYWACRQCKKFQLCDKCYDAEQKLDDRERHPTHQREKHVLYPVEITDVPADTTDKDDILENEFFDSRLAFLSLLQGNHYQYDTLRRAKHSSMMVLYHLHNPTAPAFVITCNICRFDIESGQGWRCEVCPDYDVCNACFQKDGGIDHPHKLINHPSIEDRDAQNKEARQLRVLQLRKMLELLVHASQCRSPLCQYPNCRKVKGLFRHGMHCKNRASRGCVLCKKMWYLLQIHARSCKEPECTVPRCRDLKEHTRRTQHHSETRRRAAVAQMVRQRAAEVGSSAR